MVFKNISKCICVILAIALVFSLAGCGKGDNKDNKVSEPKYSLNAKEAVVDPDMSKYESAVYTIELEKEVDSVIVYYKDDVIYGLDQNSVADAMGSKSEIDAIIENVEEKYKIVTDKGFVKFKVFYSEESNSLVMNMHARELDNKENLQALADLGIFGALSGESTYLDLDETLTAMKFVKQ